MNECRKTEADTAERGVLEIVNEQIYDNIKKYVLHLICSIHCRNNYTLLFGTHRFLFSVLSTGDGELFSYTEQNVFFNEV